jgi:glucose-1-phosphate thymidylyltransferase
VEDPRRYGVVEVDEDGGVVSIEEKPREPKSRLAQTGIYFYPPHVFSLIPSLWPSGRGELEVTDLNMEFVRTGKLRVSRLGGEWTDAGTPESYVTANRIALT